MEMIIFQKYYAKSDASQDFLNKFYQKDMHHLASDLLMNGIDAEAIKIAIKKAIISTEKAGLDSKKHFKPVISVKNGDSFLDCRLTKLGYSMLLLNTEPKNEYIATFQIKVAQKILENN